ncbi:MAG TPA: sigma factor-like helix-turn-helix DNA-binding protein [Trueperaceae bacterium]|nr:sigma factor-like helix-turn-helix DNA-binding protein [Trueperaceae bacterium]
MIPVFDGHNDTLLNHIEDPKRDFFSRQADGHVDYVRAREGGMVGGFFAEGLLLEREAAGDFLLATPSGSPQLNGVFYSPDDRAVITLVELEDYSMEDAARWLDCGLSAVKVRAFRARRRLKVVLEALRPDKEPAL